eukprot:gb/GECG01012355.1/.p1 GENE.gb/GECG01012355.1/~~gb/GECG01012355.1/.p1  ORF type:complete len:109 (+),score=11.27 gb/GECG01012355.1/:1-327(+)
MSARVLKSNQRVVQQAGMQLGCRKISSTAARRANPWDDLNTRLTRVPDQVQKHQSKFSHHRNPTYNKSEQDPIIQKVCAGTVTVVGLYAFVGLLGDLKNGRNQKEVDI